MITEQLLVKKFSYFYKVVKSTRYTALNKMSRSFLRFLQKKFPLPVIKNEAAFKGKIFCIGANKTGTSSMEYAIMSFGYIFGDFRRAEMLDAECYKGDFERLYRFSEAYDAFQDIPFSNGDYYKKLDQRFPNSKFILTIRDSGQEWFSSLTRFHTKNFSKNNLLPTEEDLKNSSYVYKGFALDFYKWYLGYPAIPLYDKEAYIHIYNERNQGIIEYFKDRPDQLLILNVKEDGAYHKLGKFLGFNIRKDKKFPHINKT